MNELVVVLLILLLVPLVPIITYFTVKAGMLGFLRAKEQFRSKDRS